MPKKRMAEWESIGARSNSFGFKHPPLIVGVSHTPARINKLVNARAKAFTIMRCPHKPTPPVAGTVIWAGVDDMV